MHAPLWNIYLYLLFFIAEYLYWQCHFLPILLIVTLSPSFLYMVVTFSCWSWHSDNEIKVDGKGTFGCHFSLNTAATKMLVILSKNHQSPKFTPHQYFILYGISVIFLKSLKVIIKFEQLQVWYIVSRW